MKLLKFQTNYTHEVLYINPDMVVHVSSFGTDSVDICLTTGESRSVIGTIEEVVSLLRG